jgi:hypothetical protein
MPSTTFRPLRRRGPRSDASPRGDPDRAPSVVPQSRGYRSEDSASREALVIRLSRSVAWAEKEVQMGKTGVRRGVIPRLLPRVAPVVQPSGPFGGTAAADAPRSDAFRSTPPGSSGACHPTPLLASRLQHHADFWDRWCQQGFSVPDIVRYGTRLDFEKSPPTTTTLSPVQPPQPCSGSRLVHRGPGPPGQGCGVGDEGPLLPWLLQPHILLGSLEQGSQLTRQVVPDCALLTQPGLVSSPVRAPDGSTTQAPKVGSPPVAPDREGLSQEPHFLQASRFTIVYFLRERGFSEDVINKMSRPLLYDSK